MQRELERLSVYAASLRNGEITRLDYLTRTKVERSLYLGISDCVRDICGVEIDGIVCASWSEAVENSRARISAADLQVIARGRDAYCLLRRLSSSNPYDSADTQLQFGGRTNALRGLGNAIQNFADAVREMTREQG